MLCRDSRTPLPENDLEQDGHQFGKASVAIAVIWLALYGYMAVSSAFVSLGGPIATARAMQ